MKAFHILSSRPSGESFHPAFFEVASMALSALLWKKYNGEITLYTDKKGLGVVEEYGMKCLWDSIDTNICDSLPTNINWSIFWAGAKLFVLQNEPSPVVILDTDLFIWQNVDYLLEKYPLLTLHREDLIDCYLPKNKLRIADHYTFPDGLDWSVKPCNTAFAFFADDAFKDLYTQEAIRFMENNLLEANDGNSRMVFAEQRLLAMLAARERVEMGTLIDDPFSKDNRIFTHLWGAKTIARKDSRQRIRLEEAILLKIKDLSKEVYERLTIRRPSSGREIQD